jgi:pyrroline-5-carboxylate reductase
VVLATRPGDAVSACREVVFQPEQVVVSVAVGLPLFNIKAAITPATAVRALPISCAAIQQSPTLLFPDHPQARALFSLLGRVHVLTDEAQFTAASTVSAFYGWVYALLDEAAAWTARAGVSPQTARDLVLETVRGAAGMALAHPEQDLATMLDALATPGGITEQGLVILHRRGSLVAWTRALEAVLERLSGEISRMEES